MERKEAYQLIKKYGLQDQVMKVSGKNFTQTSTDILVKVIEKFTKPMPDKTSVKKTDNHTKHAVTQTSDIWQAACVTFVALLKDAGVLDEILKKL